MKEIELLPTLRDAQQIVERALRATTGNGSTVIWYWITPEDHATLRVRLRDAIAWASDDEPLPDWSEREEEGQ